MRVVFVVWASVCGSVGKIDGCEAHFLLSRKHVR